MSSSSSDPVTGSGVKLVLGFAEKVSPRRRVKLRSRYFPSKAGGTPSWLALEDLPEGQRMECTSCGQRLLFLLQVYAPRDSEDEAFHRTLFVFCCNRRDCSSPSFKVFRSQLKRNNPFYPFDAPDYDADEDEDGDEDDNHGEEKEHPNAGGFGIKLCSVCGCFGSKRCASCQKVNYCSREHQVFDWKEGGHKLSCGMNANGDDVSPHALNGKPGGLSKLLFPEYELVIEEEEEGEESASESDSDEDEDEGEKLKYYEECMRRLRPKLQDEQSIDGYVQESDEDRVFLKFKAGIRTDPEQVVRYYRCEGGAEAEPLWVSLSNRPPEIPSCSSCSSSRTFEFQIMPQLINFLGKDVHLDWGVLAVYTCRNNCKPTKGSTYVDEFIWKQDVH